MEVGGRGGFGWVGWVGWIEVDLSWDCRGVVDAGGIMIADCCCVVDAGADNSTEVGFAVGAGECVF